MKTPKYEINIQSTILVKAKDDTSIPRLLALLDIELELTEISSDQALWDEVIHVNMDNPGVLPVPFKQSFDEYSDWDELWELDKCSHMDFIAWIKSMLVSMGHKFYEVDVQKSITIPGFATLYVDNDITEDGWFVNSVKLDMLSTAREFESGAYFWHDYIPEVARDANINLDQLYYELASINVLDKIKYEDTDRWMPLDMKKAIKLAVTEGLTQEEMNDREYMDYKYSTWLENGLLD